MSSSSYVPLEDLSAKTHEEATSDQDNVYLDDDQDIDPSLPTQAPKQLSFLNGLALVISLQIGSGIFSAPSQVSAHVPSPWIAISVWLVGGMLVYTGAVSFIYLAAEVPRNGGIQEYLQHFYGDFLAFQFTCTYLVIGKPAAMAVIATVFSGYLLRAVRPNDPLLSPLMNKLVALVGLWSVSFTNALGAKAGATVANGFLLLKLLAVVSVISIGCWSVLTGHENPQNAMHLNTRDSPAEKLSISDYTTALFGVLFCYGGWESVGASTFWNDSRVEQLTIQFQARLCSW